MEKLKTYLHGKHKGDFAKVVGIRADYLSQLLNGNRQPSLDLMRRISRQTDGEIDLNSWDVDA